MFFWLSLITFLVSILIYGLYPRSDGYRWQDVRSAEKYAQLLIMKHVAGLRTIQAGGYNSDELNTSAYMPKGVTVNIPDNYASKVVCISHEDKSISSNCTITGDHSDFLITYMSYDDTIEASANDIAYALGKALYFIPPNEKISISTKCGEIAEDDGSARKQPFAEPYGSTYYLTDTRYQQVRIPQVIVDSLPEDATFMCITALHLTYKQDDNHEAYVVYPPKS